MVWYCGIGRRRAVVCSLLASRTRAASETVLVWLRRQAFGVRVVPGEKRMQIVLLVRAVGEVRCCQGRRQGERGMGRLLCWEVTWEVGDEVGGRRRTLERGRLVSLAAAMAAGLVSSVQKRSLTET
jgi:hypothetical protein